jgi:alpha-mannosidase
VHDDSGFVLPRVARFVRERLTPALHRASAPARVAAWTAPGEPVPFAEAAKQEYRPFAVGEAWGRPWGTVWFHVTGAVPAGWAHPELVVDLGFTGAGPGFQAEGTVYSPDGVVLGGIEPRRRAVPLPGGAVDLYVEAAPTPT